jgi:hypothetical protein
VNLGAEAFGPDEAEGAAVAKNEISRSRSVGRRQVDDVGSGGHRCAVGALVLPSMKALAVQLRGEALEQRAEDILAALLGRGGWGWAW